MTTLFNSLAEISDSYTVFEKDQVLTESQLNSVSRYLDDQDRLSRIHLHGVGIVCGLNVALSGSTVRLDKGLGITTDGDLIRVDVDRVYNKFKAYDNQYPKYPPLYVDEETMLPVFELVSKGESDPMASSLSQFNGSSGFSLENMTALLLMESYIKDSDLCSGTDCDNRGQDYISRLRLLLVEKSSVSSLMPDMQTSAKAARKLSPLVAARVGLSASLTTQAQLANQYRTACNAMTTQLNNELPRLWTHLSAMLSETFSADPTAGWITRLNTLKSNFTSSHLYIQYYYDFLKDLINTWNEMHDLLFAENGCCNPDISGFAKHLMLGNLKPDINDISSQMANRLDFYPSAAIQRGAAFEEARFLLKKIDAMINNFTTASISTLRITPSHTPAVSLQSRAIPGYYRNHPSRPIHEYWNFRLTRREMAHHNFGYRAGDYDAEGAAASPLESCIAANDFFRIEGHLGKSVSSVLTNLQDQIKNFNLPFTVRSILLGTSKDNIPDKKGAGYTDLHRFHYLFRQDLVHRLDEVKNFSASFTGKINEAVANKTVKDDVDGNDSVSVTAIAAEKNSSINNKTAAARNKLNKSFADYARDSSWQSDIGDTLLAAGQYKHDLAKVVSTSYVTSFDHLIGNTTYNWLPWLEGIIRHKDDRVDEKKLFRNFIKDYPGLEHSGGVIRGGTFVLLYDDSGTVIADFMLSHYCEEIIEESEPEPPLQKPNIPKGEIDLGGIRITPSRDNYLTDKFDTFKTGMDLEWQDKFNFQNSYVDAFKDSFRLFGDTFFQNVTPGADYGIGGIAGSDGKPGTGGITGGGYADPLPVDKYSDNILIMNVNRAREEMTHIKFLEEKIADTTTSAEEKILFEKERDKSQKNLSSNVQDIVNHVSSKGSDVTAGAEAAIAMENVRHGMDLLKSNTTMMNESKTALNEVMESTSNDGLKVSLGSILGR
jgi:hypothetical protein